MAEASEETDRAGLSWELESWETSGEATLSIGGRLDGETLAAVWSELRRRVRESAPARLVVEAGDVSYCDVAGAALLVELRRQQLDAGREYELRRAPEDLHDLLRLFEGEPPPPPPVTAHGPAQRVEALGQRTLELWRSALESVEFLGEVLIAVVGSLATPRKFRWRDTLVVAEKVGANALPLVAAIGAMLGLILSFEAANLMRRYGAEIYVADLVSVSTLRELGPLLTAVVLAGRSGSAFAAELGTMKINEELNALSTMGLDPMRFLVVPRVMAGVLMMPLLTIFLSVAAISASCLVLASMGIHPKTFLLQLGTALDLGDYLGGLFKACVLGMLVIGTGCLKGLRTRAGAAAVGESTTSAVVTGILLISLTDGLFSILYYNLGI